MENGRITGKGTHDELLASHALYREFAVEQLQLFKNHPTESLYIEKPAPDCKGWFFLFLHFCSIYLSRFH
jgi:hypothetical protein